MRSPDMYTLPLALRSLQSPVGTGSGALMAGSAISALPLLLLFAVSTRQLIAGLTAGAFAHRRPDGRRRQVTAPSHPRLKR